MTAHSAKKLSDPKWAAMFESILKSAAPEGTAMSDLIEMLNNVTPLRPNRLELLHYIWHLGYPTRLENRERRPRVGKGEVYVFPVVSSQTEA